MAKTEARVKMTQARITDELLDEMRAERRAGCRSPRRYRRTGIVG